MPVPTNESVANAADNFNASKNAQKRGSGRRSIANSTPVSRTGHVQPVSVAPRTRSRLSTTSQSSHEAPTQASSEFTFRAPRLPNAQSSKSIGDTFQQQQRRTSDISINIDDRSTSGSSTVSQTPRANSDRRSFLNDSLASSSLWESGSNRSLATPSLFDVEEDSDRDSDDGETGDGRSEIGQNKSAIIDDDAFKRDLIEYVRENSILWNHSENDHKNLHKTEEAWREIGAALGREWKDCHDVWHRLRNEFMRQFRKLPPSGSGYDEARASISWRFYASMEFLTDVLKPRRTSSNYRPIAREVSPAVVRPNPIKRKKNDAQQSIISSMQETREQLMSALGSSTTAAPPPIVEDSFDTFGGYIASELRECPPSKRRAYKAKLLQIVVEMNQESEDEESDHEDGDY